MTASHKCPIRAGAVSLTTSKFYCQNPAKMQHCKTEIFTAERISENQIRLIWHFKIGTSNIKFGSWP